MFLGFENTTGRNEITRQVSLSRKFRQVSVRDSGVTPRHPREERFKIVLETWGYPRQQRFQSSPIKGKVRGTDEFNKTANGEQ